MTANKKIDQLVVYKNKEMKIDPFIRKNLKLVEALNIALDTALILMDLIEREGESK